MEFFKNPLSKLGSGFELEHFILDWLTAAWHLCTNKSVKRVTKMYEMEISHFISSEPCAYCFLCHIFSCAILSLESSVLVIEQLWLKNQK